MYSKNGNGLVSNSLQKKPSLSKRLFWGLFSFFIASRLMIILTYPSYISDIPNYYNWATQALVHSQAAYQGFVFPYPPLALPLVYAPMEFFKEFNNYRHAFQIEMFLIECLLFYFLIQYAVLALKLSAERTAAVAVAYTLLGLWLGRLLYDRLDIVVSLFFVLILFSYSHWKNSKRMQYFFGTLGALIKIVPGLMLIVTAILQSFAKQPSSIINTLKEISKAMLIIIIFLVLYNFFSHGALLKDLLLHQQRGIQVESLWATPWILKHIFNYDTAVQIIPIYGAHHLTNIPLNYFNLSKYFGFIILAAMMVWLWLCLARTKTYKTLSPELFLLTCFTVLLTFLSSQRVLSTQFFIWLMPFVSLWCFSRPRFSVAFAFFTLYALTYYEFMHYWALIDFQAKPVYALAMRNVLLLGICIYFLGLWVQALRALSR